MSESEDKKESNQGSQRQGPKVKWDTSNLKSSYANVCAVNSTREELVLNFGINKAWERNQDEVQIELTSRVILSPFAAQRLLDMLSKLMNEYESRYGDISGTSDNATH